MRLGTTLLFWWFVVLGGEVVYGPFANKKQCDYVRNAFIKVMKQNLLTRLDKPEKKLLVPCWDDTDKNYSRENPVE